MSENVDDVPLMIGWQTGHNDVLETLLRDKFVCNEDFYIRADVIRKTDKTTKF